LLDESLNKCIARTRGALGFVISVIGAVVCLGLVRGIQEIWNLAISHLIRLIMDEYTLNWSIVESDVRGRNALDELYHRRLRWPRFVRAKRVVTMVWNLIFLLSDLYALYCFTLQISQTLY
jgi:hypothetical protein